MALKKTLFAFLLSIPLLSLAQKPEQLSSSEIKVALQKLSVAGSVLYIAAHPDDENTRLLSYLAKESKLRTGYLSITRGDGGQNLIGNEQAELLGLLRTQELLAARRIDGAEQFFTRANDFGFSKTSAETFNIWGKEQTLSDVVWVIRKFRPDVIITRFPEDGRAGHGHHAASAILAREAFTAAADAKRFPEQLKWVQPWQAKRIVWNTYNFGGNNAASTTHPQLNIGIYNPLLGKSYGEIAAESRSSHKSQGFGSPAQRGVWLEDFVPIAGKAAQKSIFEGIDFSWNRIPGAGDMGSQINDVLKAFDEDKPEKSVNALLGLLKQSGQIKDAYWRAQKEKELKHLIAACAGLWFEADADEAESVVDEPLKLRMRAIHYSGSNIAVKTGSGWAPLKKGEFYEQELTIQPGTITQPYWLASADHPIGYYIVKKQQQIGDPENADLPEYRFSFTINGQQLTFDKTIVYKSTDPVRGEVYQPLVIAPPVTATPADHSILFSEQKPKTIQLILRSFKPGVSGNVAPEVPAGWQIDPAKAEFNLPDKGDELALSFKITPSAPAKSGKISFAVETGGKTYGYGLETIRYEHIPKQTLFPPASANLIDLDLKTGGKRVAYLPGAGDLVPASLKSIGYEVTPLTESQVLNTDLSGFDAIITGIRAYNVNDRMRMLQPRLLEYVEKGGTLLLQYNTNGELKTEKLGPFPFSLSRERVTEEKAAVEFLNPSHPVMNYPNKITQKDFEGWVQERGLYFATDMDKNYTPLFAMNDTGETPANGSVLVANYGKGRYVYTSLSFFRQLPAGVAGAYRLFVNLISISPVKENLAPKKATTQ